jgi:hypothetical protein
LAKGESDLNYLLCVGRITHDGSQPPLNAPKIKDAVGDRDAHIERTGLDAQMVADATLLIDDAEADLRELASRSDSTSATMLPLASKLVSSCV